MGNNNYDFQNVFSLIGIDSFDLDFLKRKASQLCASSCSRVKYPNKAKIAAEEKKIKSLEEKREEELKSSSPEKTDEINAKYDKLIENSNSSIEKSRKIINHIQDSSDKYNKELQKCQDIFNPLYNIVAFENILLLQTGKNHETMTDEEKTKKDALTYLNNRIKNKDDAKEYIVEELYPLGFIDIEHHNNKDLEYSETPASKSNMYKYAIGVPTSPKKVFEQENDVGKKITAYNIGSFYPSWAMSSDLYHIYTIEKEGKNHEVTTYNVVGEFDKKSMNDDKDFYANVVFSDIVLRNARDNNFGYVGSISKLNSNREPVIGDIEPGADKGIFFNLLYDRETISLLSYAEGHKPIGCISSETKNEVANCKNLKSYYRVMNEKVKLISAKDKIKKEAPSDPSDDGR